MEENVHTPFRGIGSSEILEAVNLILAAEKTDTQRVRQAYLNVAIEKLLPVAAWCLERIIGKKMNLACQYCRMTFDDFHSCAVYGLIRAVMTYDSKCSSSFLKHCEVAIFRELDAFITEFCRG